VLTDVIYNFFHCFLSVYTQYLWPISTISPISPMHCFYRPVVYYWYTGGAWPLQTSLGSLVRFGQM